MSTLNLTSTNDLRKQLLDIVKELLIHHGVEHKSIIKEIRNVILEEATKLPKIQVLYNNTYGGFGLSKEFKIYVRKHADEPIASDYVYNNDSIRVKAVPHIVPFGKEQTKRYPTIYNMLCLYEHYELSKVASLATTLYYRCSSVKELEERRIELERCLNNSRFHGNNVLKNYVDDDEETCNKMITLHELLYYPRVNAVGFTKQTYETALQKINEDILEKQTAIDKERSRYTAFNISSDICTDLEDIIFQMIEDDISYKHKTYIRSRNIDEYSFLDTLSKFDASDAIVWDCQSRFNKYAMRYLSIKRNDNEDEVACGNKYEDGDHMVYDFIVSKSYIQISPEVHDKVIKELGLECASSKYCTLAIGDVSQYVNWSIGEYDGLENICT
jgi:hypothetical protein